MRNDRIAEEPYVGKEGEYQSVMLDGLIIPLSRISEVPIRRLGSGAGRV